MLQTESQYAMELIRICEGHRKALLMQYHKIGRISFATEPFVSDQNVEAGIIEMQPFSNKCPSLPRALGSPFLRMSRTNLDKARCSRDHVTSSAYHNASTSQVSTQD